MRLVEVWVSTIFIVIHLIAFGLLFHSKSPHCRSTLMDIVVLTADNPFGPCVRVISQGAAQERETEPTDDPNGIPTTQVLRRSVRSASSHTAYEKGEESHNCPSKRRRPKRHFMSCHKCNTSLFKDDPLHVRKELCRRRRKPGFRTRTSQIGPVSQKEECFSGMTPPCSRVRREPGETSASTDIIPASLLLSLTKKSIDREVDWFGQRPCMMDVVLDLRDLAQRSTEALSLVDDMGQFNQDLHPLYRTYTFRDQRSLDTYWNDQAAILTRGIWVDDTLGNNGFPESVERSTANWPSEVVNGEDE